VLRFANQADFDPPHPTEIGILLGIDSKMAWTHWKHFQVDGLSDALIRWPSILTAEQLDQVSEFAMDGFYSRQPVGMFYSFSKHNRHQP
jgi:hypothetical protein